VLINAGRGGLQNEADILAALDEGSLSAVTLDVFQHEPLPAESALWSNPKVTITPHAAATSSPPHLVPADDPADGGFRGRQARSAISSIAPRNTDRFTVGDSRSAAHRAVRCVAPASSRRSRATVIVWPLAWRIVDPSSTIAT
jgi:hypothetical protein